MLDLKHIYADFGKIPAPTRTNIFPEDIAAIEGQSEIDAWVRQPRSEIDLKTMSIHCEAIYLMNASAFLYFIPRIIELAIREPEEAIDIVIYFAGIFSKKYRSRKMRQDIDVAATSEMKAHIREFLIWYREAVSVLTDDERLYDWVI